MADFGQVSSPGKITSLAAAFWALSDIFTSVRAHRYFSGSAQIAKVDALVGEAVCGDEATAE